MAGEVARFGIPTLDGDNVSFVVRECLPEDAGAYTCVAENAAGKTSCCAAVFVTGEDQWGSIIPIRTALLSSIVIVVLPNYATLILYDRFLPTDFETISSMRSRAHVNKSIMGSGKPLQPPREGQDNSRGSTGTSPNSSDPQSPVSSPRGYDFMGLLIIQPAKPVAAEQPSLCLSCLSRWDPQKKSGTPCQKRNRKSAILVWRGWVAPSRMFFEFRPSR